MRNATSGDPELRILARPEHNLSRKNLSTEALKVLYRLHRSGYLAYLVGGGVRDLLLGGVPKDFDIATNARPEEVRRLFRNSRIIGRRFRLVHVIFRGVIVEVATFRASPEAPEGPDEWEEAEAEAAEGEVENGAGLAPLVDDEAFGSPAEDARRRDLSINAIFYNIADFSILDYVGGVDDLRAGLIRTIGRPEQRFAEDPVRMMRALEYGVRLGFDVEAETAAAINSCRSLIAEASPARLTYELLESLRSGSAAEICAAWQRAGVFSRAFPDLPPPDQTTAAILGQLDRRAAEGVSLADATMLGAFFLPDAVAALRSLTNGHERFHRARYLDTLRDVLAPAAASMHLANHTIHLLHQALFTLSKLMRPPERGRQVLKLERQDYFPVAWELCSCAAAVGLMPGAAFESWSNALRRVRREGADALDEPRPRSRRQRRARRRRRR